MQAALNIIGAEMKSVEQQFVKDLESDVPLIRKVGEYVLSSGGKRIRPALLLLAAHLCGYQGNQAVPLASVIEFIHTATLLHDDVVDSATLRRGIASANTLWGNEASVLVGDFLFSKSFSLMVAVGSMDVLRVLSNATTVIAEGEVLQLLCTGELDLTEEQYVGVVRSKTAILMSAACEAGAILGAVSPEKQQALANFGMDLGIAFQLMDDTLDYIASEEEFGKSIGHDLEEGKITLPLIHTLRQCNQKERDVIAAVVEKDEMSLDEFREVSGLVKRYGGIEYSIASARRYIDACSAHLELFEAGPVREALLDLAGYVVTRSR
ncbi:polyprenyl synthetase family protein [Geobacter sp. SVR]|uniref:polyprenyl synthetase family protein n=1 Tax=Geobacter sp. SVR TaxID=2495594 RepID=UPI00143F03EB|nr:polyprenyl synthetase family protein [Geobacter sp. SVR]BCS53961.1 octaprenyl diphosphate synthase [Geobacter sp. SVR]GCF86258.1 octaprenyl diphosphate synthase [Geobacter sp. SVR]